MRKVFLSVAALALLSTSTLADDMGAYNPKELRREHLAMTITMVDSQIAMMKQQQEMLTAFQTLLKKAMERDTEMEKGMN